MKRLLSITVALLAIAVGAWAQHFTIDPPLPGGQSSETVVYAKLVTGTTLSGNLANYEIAALVDGNVRAIVTGNTDSYAASVGATAADFNYFVFSIPGNFTGTADTDNGKPITFKMYNSTTGLEYDLTSPALTFDGERHGTQSALFELSVTEVTGISLNQEVIYMNWDEERDLTNNVNLLPDGATRPNNLQYNYIVVDKAAQDLIFISDEGILSAVEEAASSTQTYAAMVRLGNMGYFSANFSVMVFNHVTDMVINEGCEPIVVNVGNGADLQAKLEAAFTVTPANTTDKRSYASNNAAIVSISTNPDGTTNFNPVAAGTTTVTVAYTWSEGSNNYASFTKQITVKVVQPVTAIDLLYQSFECNVGDDLTEFIKQCYKVTPDEATDKSVTYELAPGAATGIITIEGNTITATSTGVATIIVRSVSNPEVYASIAVGVEDWATSVELDRSSYQVTYKGNDIDISQNIFGNYDHTTGNWTLMGIATTQPMGKAVYSMSVVSSDTKVVEISSGQGGFQNGWGATVKEAGDADLTFTLIYPDYMAGTPGQPVEKTVKATLSVQVTQGVTGFSISPASIEMNVDDEVDLAQYVTLLPEGVSFSSENYVWTLAEESHSQYLEINGNTLKALAPNTEIQGSTVHLTLQGYEDLGSKDIFVTVYQPASEITINGAITVNKGDWESLKSQMESAITVDPTDHTDVIVWETDDEEYIAKQNVGNDEATILEWVPIKGGQTTMTVKAGKNIYDASGIASSFEVHASAKVTVNINVPIERITLTDTNKPYINIGDDITEYLNSCITILPEDATNPTYHFISYNDSRITVTSDGHVKAVGAGAVLLRAVADDGSGKISGNFTIGVYNQAKDVSFAKDITVKYTGSDVDISEEVKNNIAFDPSDASLVNVTVTSSNSSVATVAVDDARNLDGTPVDVTVTATAKSLGETTVSMTVTYIDYLAERMDGQEHRTSVTRSFKIIVSEGLTGFEIAAALPDPMAARTSYELILKPQPEDAEFSLNGFSISADAPIALDKDFVEFDRYLDDEGNAVFEIWTNYPGVGSLQIRYDDGTSQLNVVENGTLNVGVATYLDNGWQWKTLWGPISRSDIQTHFGTEVDEVRSQSALMAYDPQYGYFGELYEQGLQPGVAYKINASGSIDFGEAAIQTGGSYLEKDGYQPLKKAWTWIGNPYVLDHRISDVITTATEGDKIVSKDGGFAEYSGGAWTGSLTNLFTGQSYLYYNNASDESHIQWPAETTLGALSRSARINAPRKVQPQSAWQYDASPYRDNMSIVAVVNGQSSMVNDQWTIGAFVDGECRGEGVCIDGRMFITVHANSGEQISFRLRNELTGELYDIDQTVTMQLMAGSVKAPVQLTSQAVVTGVKSIENGTLNIESYDLGGRAVNATTKGMTIQRASDGSVRKVVK